MTKSILDSSFVSLASASTSVITKSIVPPFGLMISERLHDVQEVQEHLGRRQVGRPCGWTTSCRCHLNWAQYQMKSQHGRHGVGETSLERRKKTRERERDICCLKVREERLTSRWKLLKMTSLFVSRRGWGSGRIDDEIRRLYRHLLKQQASMLSPRPRGWWAEAARIDESPQVTELTISRLLRPYPELPCNDFKKKHS